MRTILALLVALALAGVAAAQTTTDPTTGDGFNDPDAVGDPADNGPSIGAPGDQENVNEPGAVDGDPSVGAPGDQQNVQPGDQGVNNAVWIALAIAALVVVGIVFAMSRRKHDDAVLDRDRRI